MKFTLREKANHVPFIIIAPGVTKPGTRCDATHEEVRGGLRAKLDEALKGLPGKKSQTAT